MTRLAHETPPSEPGAIPGREEASHAQSSVKPAHLAPLAGGEWSVWRSVCLRGAGFPAEMLLELAAPASAAAADAWSRAERRVAGLREQLSTPHEPCTSALERQVLGARAAAIKQEIREATAASAEARAALDEAFARDTSRTTAYLSDCARDPRLREAVLWQNREAVHTGFDALARGISRPSRRVQKERLVASYLQRYCAKNDTIGFFGPVGWARIVDDGPAVAIEPGPQLVNRRTVHFETWAIDALAGTLDAHPGLRPWIAPRLLPQVRVEGTQILAPGRAPIAIAALHARLLRACDGSRTARAIARDLVGDPSSGVKRDADVLVALEAFAQMGLVIWSLQVPIERDPDRSLRARLDAVGDPAVRAKCVGTLDRLDACRQAVARAAGDPEALDQSLADLAAAFTAITAAAPTRSAGEMYAGRTLVYEDCRRNAHVELGPGLLGRLGPALSLLLESARWCTFEIATWYRAELESIVTRMGVGANGTADLAMVLAHGPDFGGAGEIPRPIAVVAAELRRRWAAILGLRLDVQHARYSSRDLLPSVRSAFEAPTAGWSWARHVSPDVLISATSADAIARGEYLVVLGEIHLLNTLVQLTCADEHPDPSELQRALDADCPQAAVVPVHSRAAFSGRTAIGMLPSTAFWYEQSRDIASGPRARVLRTSDLVVQRDQQGLVVRTRDGRVRLDAVEFLGYFLAMKCATIFGLLPDAPHTPRISIDEVVVARERWQAPASTMTWAWADAPIERFAGARRWAGEKGIPRFAFIKSPIERKPCYVDFDSPTYVDAFAKMVREAGKTPGEPHTIGITEMMPAPHGLWLVDTEGRRFTSELRMVAVDPRAPDVVHRAAAGGVS